jgi:hypothetical protein
VRSSDGAIIQTQDIPINTDGLQTCVDANLTSAMGFFVPDCSDGG